MSNQVHRSDWRWQPVNEVSARLKSYCEISGALINVGAIIFCIAQGGVSWMPLAVFVFSSGFFSLSFIWVLINYARHKDLQERELTLKAAQTAFDLEKQYAAIEIASKDLSAERKLFRAEKDPVVKMQKEKVDIIKEDGAETWDWKQEQIYTNNAVQEQIGIAIQKLQKEATGQHPTVPSSWKYLCRSPWQKNAILKDIGLSMSNKNATNTTAGTVLKRVTKKVKNIYSPTP